MAGSFVVNVETARAKGDNNGSRTNEEEEAVGEARPQRPYESRDASAARDRGRVEATMAGSQRLGW